MINTDTCLLVHSGDRGAWLWPTWYKHYKEHWNCQAFIDTVFLGENDFFSLDNDRHIHSMMTGPVPWGVGLLAALSRIPCKWIIYHHEDYFIDGPVDRHKMIGLLHLCDTHNFKVLKICGKWAGDPDYEKANMKRSGIVLCTGSEGDEPIYIYDNRQQYTISHQSTIWDRKFLMDTIIPCETPWHHELEGSKRMQRVNPRIHAYCGKAPIPYTETVIQGRIRPGCDHYFKERDTNAV